MLIIKTPEKHNTGGEIESTLCVCVCVHFSFFNNRIIVVYLYDVFSSLQFTRWKCAVQ